MTRSRVNDRRRYDNSGRAAQAAANRSAVLAAGCDALVAHGYRGTTVAAVARAAGVSVETVYKAFGTKAELVRQILGAAVVGDDEPVALIDRPQMQAALLSTTGAAVLEAFVDLSCAVLLRAGPLLAALLVAGRAGDPELRMIARQAGEQRHADFARIADALAATGDLRVDLDAEHAADVLWTLGSPEVYVQFTDDRRWRFDEYRTWLSRTLQATLLRDPIRHAP